MTDVYAVDVDDARRVVVVGAGPGGVRQLLRARREGYTTVLVTGGSDGNLGRLGHQRLQSYVDELELNAEGCDLRKYTGPFDVSPTGRQYATYVRDIIASLSTHVVRGLAVDVWREGDRCVVGVVGSPGHDRYLKAQAVILTTGLTPCSPPAEWTRIGAVSVDRMYDAIAERDTAWFAGRSMVIVGGGNSAMQIAAQAAPIAYDVRILARRYVGMFPQESPDRFAWRAASQVAYELVVKSAQRCASSGHAVPCIRLLVYDDLSMSDDEIEVSYSTHRNMSRLGLASLPNNHPHICRVESRALGCVFTERIGIENTIIVWATGYQPCYPGGPTIRELTRDPRGFLRRAPSGATEMKGLFVAGACAGYRAVNEMIEVELDHAVTART